MEITLIQALLIGLYYWWATTGAFYTWDKAAPMVCALPIGLIMGNVPQAMIIGAFLQMVYTGIVSGLGGVATVDKPLAACVTIPIALATGMAPEVAVAVAIPFGVLGANINHLQRIILVWPAHMADRFAEDADYRGVARCATIYPMLIKLALRVLPVALIVYLGPAVVQAAMDRIPEALMHGFVVAGGLLPAMGFGLTLKVIDRKDLLHYFVGGFFLVQYSGLGIMSAAIFGTVLAFMYLRGKPVTGGAANGD